MSASQDFLSLPYLVFADAAFASKCLQDWDPSNQLAKNDYQLPFRTDKYSSAMGLHFALPFQARAQVGFQYLAVIVLWQFLDEIICLGSLEPGDP